MQEVVLLEDSPTVSKLISLVTTHTLEQVLAEKLDSVEMGECAAGVLTMNISNALTQAW